MKIIVTRKVSQTFSISALAALLVAAHPATAQKKIYKNLDAAVSGLVGEGKSIEALNFLLSKTGYNPSADENFSRADLLEKLGHYQLALGERIQGIQKGKLAMPQISRVGELALVTDRLEPLVPVAVGLNKARVDEAKWPASFRAALASLYLRLGDLRRAVAVAPDASELSSLNSAARVKAIHVVAALEFAQGRLDRAAQILRNATEIKALNPGLAYLQRSRIYFEAGRYDLTLGELVNVPRSNPAWYPGVLTAAWSAYHLQDYNLALGQLMTLINPYLAGKFNPEAWILESNVLYRLCHYQSSLATLKTLKDRYKDLPRSIQKFKRLYGGRYQGVSTLLNAARGEAAAQNDIPTAHWSFIVDGVLSDESMADVDRSIIMARSSLKFLQSAFSKKSSSGVRSALAYYSKDLDLVKREALRKGIRVMDRKLDDMIAATNDALESALAIEVEINTRLRERLITGKVPVMKEIDFEAEVNKGYEFWPFQGEFWRDEAGSFVFATSDVCGTSKEGT
jgi:hypothetical protein